MDSRYKPGGIEDIVAEMEELFDIPDELVEGDEEYRIICCGWWVHIPALDLCLHEGIFLYMTKVSGSICWTFPSH